MRHSQLAAHHPGRGDTHARETPSWNKSRVRETILLLVNGGFDGPSSRFAALVRTGFIAQNKLIREEKLSASPIG